MSLVGSRLPSWMVSGPRYTAVPPSLKKPCSAMQQGVWVMQDRLQQGCKGGCRGSTPLRGWGHNGHLYKDDPQSAGAQRKRQRRRRVRGARGEHAKLAGGTTQANPRCIRLPT
jgi:hypothetical protein